MKDIQFPRRLYVLRVKDIQFPRRLYVLRVKNIQFPRRLYVLRVKDIHFPRRLYVLLQNIATALLFQEAVGEVDELLPIVRKHRMRTPTDMIGNGASRGWSIDGREVGDNLEIRDGGSAA